jgi:hypothetical protein
MKRSHIWAISIALLLVGSTALADPITDHFWAQHLVPGGFSGGGTGYLDPNGPPQHIGPWYRYEHYPAEYWYTQWFYNAPYDPNLGTAIHVEGEQNWAAEWEPYQLTLAVGWATPEWSLAGNPPGQPRQPPLPGVDESQYIARQVFFDQIWPLPTSFSFDLVISGFNTEWVSISVSGYNYFQGGTLTHECIPEPGAAGLLALGALALLRRRI